MEELIKWHNQEQDLHPVEKAAKFHSKFVHIHPFTDGNSRVSRLMMNLELIKSGKNLLLLKIDTKQEQNNNMSWIKNIKEVFQS